MITFKEAKDVGGHGSEKHHAMVFGRMNPVTSGHEAVVKKMHDVAKEHGAGHSLIVSPDGEILKEKEKGEGFIIARIDENLPKKLRDKIPSLKSN